MTVNTTKKTLDNSKTDEYWVIGYGSLIYKPPPHYDIRLSGYIRGFVRRFWQSSNDHRGTPEAPGRVVTLLETSFWETIKHEDAHASVKRLEAASENTQDQNLEDDDVVWCVIYRIKADKVDEVRKNLDNREKNGYSTHQVCFEVSQDTKSLVRNEILHQACYEIPKSIMASIYIATPDNEAYIGPQDPEKLAGHIVKSKGPSGENREYLYKLGVYLKQIAPTSNDHHIDDLILRAKRIEEELNIEPFLF
ncbi:ChaC-like protein [Nadsonia fulvescens var. elongata DSM 6958]|uniref:glutathione-specific gamma-glutamylcyclotransferase n=1 Tax=Nadsonia fulvescens var. elongata DSM 6958 TaxID=857566 RepID=A0A1E3PDZ9_9ASCO|nr:ChaC-like protein [Nadsonia fulvescens var. elongata DSM 6958]